MKPEQKVLQCAAVVLAAPGAWIRFEEAKDEQGSPVYPDDPHACQWCALGAIKAAAWNLGYTATTAREAMELAESFLGKRLTAFNDSAGSKDSVVQLLLGASL